MPLARELLDILVCPQSKAPLVYVPRGERNDDERHGFLLCVTSKLKYRLEDGIPVLLIEDAETVSAADVTRLISVASSLGIIIPA